MRVLHVSPSFFPAGHYGGPTYSTHSLCNSLARLADIELRVLTTDSDGPKRISVAENPKRLPEGYDVFYCRRRLQPDIAPGMFLKLSSMIRWADVVHLTSVYSASTIPTLLLCRLYRKPVVWSTRGALQRWNASTRTKIKSAWERVCDVWCDRQRVVLHVTSEEERLESSERIQNAAAVVIPNGIDLPELSSYEHQSAEPLRLLYLGRLHPIKGIENLLRALTHLHGAVTLAICGDGDRDYQTQLQSLAQELGVAHLVTFHGRVDGAAKEQQFREADLCVAPSFKENFCNVVAESLARGIPVIASRGTPWKQVEEVGCGLWVDNDPASLSQAIERGAHLPLREMGMRGRQWMEREYSWSSIGERMAEQYRLLLTSAHAEGSRATRMSEAA